MKLHVFTVRDIKTDQYGNPMFLINKGQALRSFGDECNRTAEDNMFNKHPEDFELCEIGTWDSDTGIFETYAPKQIALATDFIKKG